MNFIKKLTEFGQHQENRQKLFLELSDREIRIDIYHKGEFSSRQLYLQKSMEQNGVEAYVKEMASILRNELLWVLEDEVEAVFFLPEEWCYVDRLKVPKLEGREIQRTLEWELEQAVPWAPNEYYFDSILIDSQENTYMLAAISRILVDRLLNFGKELDITIVCVTTSTSIDSYLAKKSCVNLLPLRNKRHLSYQREKRAARLIVTLATAASLSVVGIAYCWSWWSEKNLYKLQNELSAMGVWNQEIEAVEVLEKRLKRLQHILGQSNKNKQSIFSQLELWGRNIGEDCWLESIEMKHGSEELLISGKSTTSVAASEFVKKLSACGIYRKVELVELRDSSIEHGFFTFNVRVLAKEVQ